MSPLRIVFMGTTSFSATILSALIEHHDVVAVYTRADAVRSRGNRLIATPVKECALAHGIPVFTPASLSGDECFAELQALRPDAICVTAYGKILPERILALPPYGAINVHTSLLPRWRGAAPIERAILAGDRVTGVSIMKMDVGLDTGPYCEVREMDIDGKSLDELTEGLARLSCDALIDALRKIADGSALWVEQDESRVTYAEKIGKHELYADPSDSAEMNVRRVCASSEAHPAKALVAGRGVRILSAHVVAGDEGAPDDRLEGAFDVGQDDRAAGACGTARFVRKRLHLTCADGSVFEVDALRPDGKGAMTAASFCAGVPVLRETGARWERLV